MKYLEYWEKFIKTGNVYDYLNYTACSLETSEGFVIEESSKGGYGDNNDFNRDSINSHADWRV